MRRAFYDWIWHHELVETEREMGFQPCSQLESTAECAIFLGNYRL